jgi:hypothetical protein
VATIDSPASCFWEEFSFIVSATGPTTSLRLIGNIDGNEGTFLDRVSVVPLGQSCPGDLDGDHVVGQSDLGILLAAYARCNCESGYSAVAGYLAAADPCVTQGDLGVLLANYGVSCP